MLEPQAKAAERTTGTRTPGLTATARSRSRLWLNTPIPPHPAPIARRRAARPPGSVLDRRLTSPDLASGAPFWDDKPPKRRPRVSQGLPRIVAADLPQPITPAMRAQIEAEVEILMSLLDAIDAPEQDMEEDNEDCCQAEEWPLPNVASSRESDDDEEDDPGEDNGDEEPSLGWPRQGINREGGELGGTDDLEQDSDAEPDVDVEPLSAPHTPDGGLLGGARDPGNPLIVMTLGYGGPVTWSGRGMGIGQ